MSERPTRVRWLVVALLAGLVFLAHFNRVGISVAANAHFIGPGRLTAEQMGLVYSAFLLVYTLLMLPGGYVLDRVGPRRAMGAMAVGLGTLAALTGVLGWTGLEVAALFVPLLLIRGLAGATSVPLHPGAARAVSLWVPPGERSTANGTVTAGALVGIALTYPVFGWLMDAVGWPAAFVVCGAALALLGVGWYAFAADSPADHPRTNAAERELVPDAPPLAAATAAEIADLVRDRSLVLLTLSYGALGYMQYMFFYWIEFYFGKVLRLPDAESRRAAFVVMMASAVGMALGGWVSDRLGRALGPRAGSRVVAVTGMGLSAAFSLCGVAATDPDAVVVWFALGLGALGLCEGLFWTTAPLLAPRNGGLACALVNTGGNGVGMLAPVVTPLLGQAYGWTTAVAVACGVCFAGGLLWFGVSVHDRGENGRA